MMTEQTVLHKHPDVATRTVDGCAVAISTAPAGGPPALLTFNATGTIIWDAVDGRTSVGEVLARLTARYPDAPEPQRRAETLALLEQLLSSGMLVEAQGAAA